MIDPLKLKSTLITILKILIIVEFASAISQGMSGGGWSRFGFDLIIAGILYVMWDRIRIIVRDKKDEFRQKMEQSTDDVKLWDALVFSLLWTDEIYGGIPRDRNRLVVIAYTLIALGVLAAFLSVGSGLMPLVISGALVLGAVNLLAWVVSRERTERDTLQTELKLAHDVQLSLMPKEEPAVPGFDIAGISIPAREVGGDHFDYSCSESDPMKFGISISDVSGKGMQAAMSAVFTSGAYASEARQCLSPAIVLTRLNSAVYSHTKRGHFVAFLMALLDLQTKTLTFSNAGQTRPLLKSNGRIHTMDSVGVHFPLGMKVDSVYEEQSVKLSSGDVLFLMTDGIPEAMNARKEVYGTERLEKVLLQIPADQLSARQILDYVTDHVRRHVSGAPQHDDVTLVVVKVL